MESAPIAVREIEIFRRDGQRTTLGLRIGRPYPSPESDDWFCEVAIDELCDPPRAIAGLDSWHALMLAFRFIELTLRCEVAEGAVLCWPGDPQPIRVEDLFGFGDWEQQSAEQVLPDDEVFLEEET
jgi:hypothetical protein